MKFLESIINMKLNSIRPDELLGMAGQYGIKLTFEEAQAVSMELRGKNYNLFNPDQRAYVVNKIAGIIGSERALQIESLFLSMTGR